jgi:hypothetical protein
MRERKRALSWGAVMIVKLLLMSALFGVMMLAPRLALLLGTNPAGRNSA